ncbi:hypothetical protein E4T47_06932 [Aureobasidium subglaciale]|nr:hypothetical protein E4T47_06932 [Aureobasidium subglaciale]
MDPNALGQAASIIATKVANKELIEVPLHCIYWSDGHEHRIPKTANLVKQDPTSYLETLSKKYSELYDVNLVFTSLPRNYTIWRAVKGGHVYLHGHLKGRFRSAERFCHHVWSLLNNDLEDCDCEVCS